MSEFIGAIDQGTTSTRFIIFTNKAHVVFLPTGTRANLPQTRLGGT